MFIVFYTVKVVYICVVMTWSTSCCLGDTHMDLWNVHMCTYVCMCVCVYIHTYVCTYVCMYLCMHVCMYVSVYV